MAFPSSLVSLLLAGAFFSPLPGLAVLRDGRAAPPFPRYSGFAEISSSKDRFCVVGDTQRTSRWEFWRERNDPERRRILAGILDRDPAFLIILGDLTVRGSSEKHWREFDANNRFLRNRKIPYFPVLGNHEHYGPNSKSFTQFFGRFPHLDGRFWYSFAWKNVGFVMLDSSFQVLTAAERREQRAWLLAELARFEKDEAIDFVIACCHQAPFTNSRVIPANPLSQADFADAFVPFPKAAFFFSGHCHSYEKFEYGGKLFVVSGGGGGPRHKVRTDPAKRAFADLYPGPELRFFHFCEVEADRERLLVTVRKLDDGGAFSVADTITVGKARPNDLPWDQRRNP